MPLTRLSYLSVLMAGGLSALVGAPWHVWPVLCVTLPLLLFWVDRCGSAWRAAWLGWIWALGYLGGTLHWITISLGVDWARFWWVAPFSLLGLPACLALTYGAVAGLVYRFTVPGVSRWVCFAGAWGIGEWLQGHGLWGGFPWTLMAYAWGSSLSFMQSLSLWGPYALGVLTVLCLSVPYLWTVGSLSLWRRSVITALVCNGLLGLYFWGYGRLMPPTFGNNSWMRLVQPNIPQTLKWSKDHQAQNLRTLYQLTRRPSPHPLGVIVWPEAALPFQVVGDHLRGLALPLSRSQVLLTGAVRYVPETGQAPNSLLAVAASGQGLGCYDKYHLVPFGEYIPGRRWLSQIIPDRWLRAMSPGGRDATPGPGMVTLDLKGRGGVPPFSPLVCFDVVFPGDVTSATNRPQWLLDVTNDAWFGASWGLDQHFAMGRFRAVEEGLPVVRVANTGISGVISPYGATLATLPVLQEGILDFQLPRCLPSTLYSRLGEGIWALLVIVCLTFGVFCARGPRAVKPRAGNASRSRR